MADKLSCNCIVCAKEFNEDELQSVSLSKINITTFKICQSCLDMSDSTDDYKEVRDIIDSYRKFAESKYLFLEVKNILKSRK